MREASPGPTSTEQFNLALPQALVLPGVRGWVIGLGWERHPVALGPGCGSLSLTANWLHSFPYQEALGSGPYAHPHSVELWTLELGQGANTPRTLREHLQLATVTGFCLLTALGHCYVCPQHQSKFFANLLYKYLLLSLKTPDFYSLGGHYLGCGPNLCTLICNFLIPVKHFYLIIAS